MRAGVLLVGASLSVLMLVPSALGQAPPSGESPNATIDRADKLIRQGKTDRGHRLARPAGAKETQCRWCRDLAGKSLLYEQGLSAGHPSSATCCRTEPGRLGVHPATGFELLRSGKVPGNLAPAGKSESSSAPGPGGCSLHSWCLLRPHAAMGTCAQSVCRDVRCFPREPDGSPDAGQDAGAPATGRSGSARD